VFELLGVDAAGEARIFSVRVPADCPYFRGHFPSRPVLPAIGQLALVVELVERAGSGPAWISGARALRFLRPILPGDELTVRMDLSTEGQVSFLVSRAGDPISEGRLLCRKVETP